MNKIRHRREWAYSLCNYKSEYSMYERSTHNTISQWTMSFPHLSMVDNGTKRGRSDDDLEIFKRFDNALYDELVSAIIKAFVPDPEVEGVGFYRGELDCEEPFTGLEGCHLRSDAVREVLPIMLLRKEVAFSPQCVHTGRNLAAKIRTETAKSITRLFFETRVASESVKVDDKEVWRQFAEDGVEAAREAFGAIPDKMRVVLELSMQQADLGTYKSRTPFIHMDGTGNSKTPLKHTYLEPDRTRGFAASFCSEKGGNTLNSDDIGILDCGTMLYDGIPVISPTEVARVSATLKSLAIFKPCASNVDSITTQVASLLTAATKAALKKYTDVDLARMGITVKMVPALTWTDAHSGTFHRSPSYDDISWLQADKMPDAWSRRLVRWAQRMAGMKELELTRPDDAPSTRMRFFSRMRLEEKTTSFVSGIEMLYEYKIEGVSVQVQRLPLD